MHTSPARDGGDVERVRPIDAEALETFRKKGEQSALKVRRVLQTTKDLLRRDLAGVRVLDLGCGEGACSIEAGLRGAQVLAVDGRSGRLDDGRAIAARHGLSNVEFRIADVRSLRRADVGEFDAVFFLGLQHRLDVPDVFDVMRNVHEMCRGVLVLDAHVASASDVRVEWGGAAFEGQSKRGREEPADAFWFTKESLCRLVHHVGFTSVFECHVPIEAAKPADRVTLAAVKGAPTVLSAYPWINGMSEADIAARLGGIPGFSRFCEKPGPKKRHEVLRTLFRGRKRRP
jgi:SAM-dependent methyltransferase